MDPNEALETVKTEVVTQIRTHVLQFLNETLPNIKIPDVGNVAAELPADAAAAKGGGAKAAGAEEDGPSVQFSVSGMKIEPGADLTIREDDIEVAFGDLLEVETGDVLTVTARNIGAKMTGVKWMFELQQFPYLFGNGEAAVELEQATIRISFKIQRDEPSGGFFATALSSSGGQGEPQLVVSSSRVEIGTLSLSIRESYVSYLYNFILWLAEDKIKDAVLEAVNSQLTGNIAEALRPINEDARVRQAMGMLLSGLETNVRRASTATRRVSSAAATATAAE